MLPLEVANAVLSNVSGSASNVTLLNQKNNRRGFMVVNDSGATLYMKFGATASLTSYSVPIAPGGFYESPGNHLYTGQIDGIWSSATGAARITELS